MTNNTQGKGKTMKNKITVRDAKGDYHKFKGTDITYQRDGNVYDIHTFEADNDGDIRRIDLASFISPMWVKNTPLDKNDNDDWRAKVSTEEVVDPFTQRDIEKNSQEHPEYQELHGEKPTTEPIVEDDIAEDDEEPAKSLDELIDEGLIQKGIDDPEDTNSTFMSDDEIQKALDKAEDDFKSRQGRHPEEKSEKTGGNSEPGVENEEEPEVE